MDINNEMIEDLKKDNIENFYLFTINLRDKIERKKFLIKSNLTKKL